jgi:peptidoglycan/xylan/chitin deacetylase (PgdA/CDA1 family)
MFSFSVGWSQQKLLSVTIDDLPTVAYGINTDEHKYLITSSIVNTLVQYEVPAIGFVNESKLYHDDTLSEFEVGLLRYWLDNGQQLGNHTFSHHNYHRVSFEEYARDITKGEKVTRPLVASYQQQLTYFRHPYLRIGRDQAHADSLSTFLDDLGYIEAPVTIDNADYLFALAYSRAFRQTDTTMMDSIGTGFVSYMEDKLVYFEKQSDKLFDRKIDQVLLLHANLLNAHYMDELLEMYQKYGYHFGSLSEVLEDSAYRKPVTEFGDYGISWIDRWALSQGKRGNFFAGDPEVPAFIDLYLDR